MCRLAILPRVPCTTLFRSVFRPIQNQLEEAEARQFLGELTEGISPHGDLGWTDVDDHISQLRQRFRSASTPVDYKDVGNRCVGVLEALSAHVYEIGRASCRERAQRS